MASQVGIVNAALIKLGEATITSLDENSKPARLANNVFEDLRDAVLQAHPWNFALARAELVADVAGPSWGHAYAYALPAVPAYCLRVLAIENAAADWRVEGRRILTDEGAPLRILYLKQVTDPNEYSALFRECLAARLAAELAEPLKQSVSAAETMRAVYERKLAEARTADAQEGTPDSIEADAWILARG
ncbi:MAG: hypothetical protein ACKVSF_11145 [Alphaproteobacteria bacterium]